ncbi:MAG: hypothetical protein IPP27_02470 [Bacteroidetes bacterium]|nr:hypothetical protein [Bacteroidota bacterium]
MKKRKKTLVEGLFSDAGYMNVERIEYNESLFEVLQEKRVIIKDDSIIKLTGIDNNLYLELYKNFSVAPSGLYKIRRQGSDPRVKILADIIIEYIWLQNHTFN